MKIIFYYLSLFELYIEWVSPKIIKIISFIHSKKVPFLCIAK